MDGTNPKDTENHSHDKPLSQNSTGASNGGSPHNSMQHPGENMNQTTASPAESPGQPAGDKKPSSVVPVTVKDTSASPSAEGVQLTQGVKPDVSKPVTPEIRDVKESPVATPRQAPVKTAALSLIEMLTHSNEHLRVEALESLLKIGDKSLSYAFASSMKDESFRVRLGALRGLYKFSGDAATDYLLAALEDKHPDVRRRAIIYLGWMRKHELLPYITAALADHSSRVRKVAAYALGDLKDSSAAPYLIKALADNDPEVAKGALAALERITGKSFTDDLPSPGDELKALIQQWNAWWEKQDR